MRNDKPNLIVDLTLDFAKGVVHYCEALEQSRRFVLANQLLKSGISIGANVRQAQNAETPRDFIHKMKIAAKEADETEYGLFLCREIDSSPNASSLYNQLQSVIRVLSKIISSSKRSLDEQTASVNSPDL